MMTKCKEGEEDPKNMLSRILLLIQPKKNSEDSKKMTTTLTQVCLLEINSRKRVISTVIGNFLLNQEEK